MSAAACVRRREVDRLAFRVVPPRRFDELSAHIRGCDRCRDHYQQVIYAERVACRPATLSAAEALVRPGSFEKRRGFARLWGELDAPAKPSPGLRVGLWTAAASVLALLLLLVPWTPTEAPDPGVTMRGGGDTPALSAELEAICVDPQQALARPLGPAGQCSQRARLLFLYSLYDPELHFLRIEARDAKGTVHRIAHDPDAGPIATQSGALDARVGRQLRLSELPAGPLEITAWFTQRSESLDVESIIGSKVPPTGVVVWRRRIEITAAGAGR